MTYFCTPRSKLFDLQGIYSILVSLFSPKTVYIVVNFEKRGPWISGKHVIYYYEKCAFYINKDLKIYLIEIILIYKRGCTLCAPNAAL